MKSSEKITYTVDPHNRLIAKKTGKASGVKGYRQVLDGRFKIGKDNSLTYHVKKSTRTDTPQQVKLSGSYSLERDRDLVLTLNKWSNQVEGNKLIIKGQLLDAKDDKLSFIVGTRDSSRNASIYILRLSGAWRADKHNRLSFNVAREGGAVNDLTLQGAWKLNNNNEIEYTHSKARLKTKENVKNALAFKGRWDITEKNRISYILNKEIDSRFDFKAAFVRARKSGLEYKIGIGAAPGAKKIMLFGAWKLSKKTGLAFEMPCSGGRVQGISFGVKRRLGKDGLLELKLKDSRGKEMEANQGLFAGVGFRW